VEALLEAVPADLSAVRAEHQRPYLLLALATLFACGDDLPRSFDEFGDDVVLVVVGLDAVQIDACDLLQKLCQLFVACPLTQSAGELQSGIVADL